MYRDFTHSAEAMRIERYRVTSTATRGVGSALRTKIGQGLVRTGRRLIDAPVARPGFEGGKV